MLEIIQGQFITEILNQNANTAAEKANIFPLPWYPDKLAWQMDLTRKEIRSNEAYYKLHNFLISETENGSISRQETVSMIPPIVLDVQAHHKVLFDIIRLPFLYMLRKLIIIDVHLRS